MDDETGSGCINAYIKDHRVDFLDFGASTGTSIEYASKIFCDGQGHGVGLDINPVKVASMEASGHVAFTADLSRLRLAQPVKFVIMSHFLEHLPGFTIAQKIVQKAVNISSEFIFIRQPYFDADGYLLSRGLKLYWSDWEGHYYHMQSIELFKICRDLLQKRKISRFCIYGAGRIVSAEDNRIHPLSSDKDQHQYDATLHPVKDQASPEFATDVFREIIVLATRSENVDFDALQNAFKWDAKLLDSVTLA